MNNTASCCVIEAQPLHHSAATLVVSTGSVIGLADDWVLDEPRTDLRLELSPDAPAIIGRADGSPVEYLDPAHVPTSIVPGTGRTVLLSGGDGRDLVVSRAHFMLRAVSGGILLVNGVPRRGGGIRPPRNGTRLVKPHSRNLNPEEVLFVDNGSSIVICLPNGTLICIAAG